MATPIAVLISDVHYSLNTLELADNAFRQAIDKAANLRVPLIDCGDLTNDKAILRAEVVNRLIAAMDYARINKRVEVYLIVGNHSLCNEKGKEHALEFLRPYVRSITESAGYLVNDLSGIPYCADTSSFLDQLAMCRPEFPTIIHQGVQGANMGHYVQDKTSLPPSAFAGRRIISGHYHARQDIKLPGGGLWSFVGNPYSLSFGEANDPEKGFQILMDDGTLQFVPTNLRKHIIIEIDTEDFYALPQLSSEDLVWLKATGTTEKLNKLKKSDMARVLGRNNFKFDKIFTDAAPLEQKTDKMTSHQLLDALIDSQPETDDTKKYLKGLWREILS